MITLIELNYNYSYFLITLPKGLYKEQPKTLYVQVIYLACDKCVQVIKVW